MTSGFHRFARLQHFRDNQLVVIEQAPDFGHARHQRAIDHIERRYAFFELQIEIGDQAVFGSLYDVVRQAFIERQVGGLFLLPPRRTAKVFGDSCYMKLVNRNLLLARLLAPIFGNEFEHGRVAVTGGNIYRRRIEQ